ncbi:MAG: GHKL domain-containing protein [Oscillospiraceae bacterium]|nr:GHKL domain-containing protein [Oscillospiraceae bacterium]
MGTVFHYFFSYYSLFVLYFFLFRNHLTRSAYKVLLLWLAATAVFSSLLTLLTPLLSYEHLHFLFADLLYFLLVFLYMLKNTRLGIQKQLFIFFLALHLTNLQSMLLYFAGSTFLSLLSETSGYLFNVSGRLVLLAVMILLLYRLFEPSLTRIKSQDIKGLWAVPLLFFSVENLLFFAILFNGAEEVWQTISPWVYTVFTSVAVVIFFTYALLLRMLSGIAKNTRMESEITLAHRQLELQKRFYDGVQKNIEDTKAARHDLRHHLSLIQSYINEGEPAKLKSYVNEYTETLPADIETVFCENFAVNSIMRYYAEIAKNEGIRLDARLELPENTGISDSDLCIVFGNCIENAVEACRRISGDRFIKVSSKFTGKMLAITIDNSFDGELMKDGGVFLSRKHEGEGVGISSVKAVARKYNETARFEAEGKVFCASITLRAEPE